MTFKFRVLLLLISLLQGCSSTGSDNKIDTSIDNIIKVSIFYHPSRKADAIALQDTLISKGYLVSVRKNKPLLTNHASYMYVAKEDHKSAVILNAIVHETLKHHLNTNFFKEQGRSGTAKVILTNTASTSTENEDRPHIYIPQLWSHHKQLDISSEQCATNGVDILNSLGFSSVVQNGNYVYGNFNYNRATIKCVNVADRTFVYTAVAGKDVTQVEQLRNQIAWKL